MTFNETLMPLLRASNSLRKFLLHTNAIPLRLSRSVAQALKNLVDEEFATKNDDGSELDWKKKITKTTVQAIHKKLDEFETVFSMEAVGLNVYAVSQKAGYSTHTLVQRGEEVIPEEVRAHLSDYSQNEMREAGRCLVFNLPTAAGFHMLRAMESVLRESFDVLSGGAARPKTSQGGDAAMGTYIVEIEKHGAAKETLEVLRQIKNLHRNPHMHPDAVLTMHESIVLLGIVVSAISIMVDEMIKKKQAANVAASNPSTPPSTP